MMHVDGKRTRLLEGTSINDFDKNRPKFTNMYVISTVYKLIWERLICQLSVFCQDGGLHLKGAIIERQKRAHFDTGLPCYLN